MAIPRINIPIGRITVNPPVPAHVAMMGSLVVTLPAKMDSVSGTLSGLPKMPSYCTAETIVEQSVVVQSGIGYSFIPTGFTSSGFNWTLSVLNNEYWPGPSSVNLLVDYAWGV